MEACQTNWSSLELSIVRRTNFFDEIRNSTAMRPCLVSYFNERRPENFSACQPRSWIDFGQGGSRAPVVGLDSALRLASWLKIAGQGS